MSRTSRMLLALTLALGGTAALAGPAPAAGIAAAPALAGAAPAAASSLLEEVRWVQRCRPQVVHRRDRFGRPVTVRREVCRRVWVEGRRGPPGYYR